MSAIGCIVLLPADSNASTRSPSSVPVRMCAVVSDPRRMLPLIVNVTRASPLRSFNADTVPTFIPDTVTVLRGDDLKGPRNGPIYKVTADFSQPRLGGHPSLEGTALPLTFALDTEGALLLGASAVLWIAVAWALR